MNVDELMQVVRNERLDAPVLYGAGQPGLDDVVVRSDDGRWRVYLSDERGEPFAATLREFANESDALQYALQKLRQVSAARVAKAALRAKQAADGNTAT
ncbi:hypothetical protein [Microbacterium sp. bgisy203]|uniref:hypothetical protein n=1 Tax=Microbacterium sp. bgisy203 TaxID=3413799 RepID=UPI003D747FD0